MQNELILFVGKVYSLWKKYGVVSEKIEYSLSGVENSDFERIPMNNFVMVGNERNTLIGSVYLIKEGEIILTKEARSKEEQYFKVITEFTEDLEISIKIRNGKVFFELLEWNYYYRHLNGVDSYYYNKGYTTQDSDKILSVFETMKFPLKEYTTTEASLLLLYKLYGKKLFNTKYSLSS